MRSSEKWKGCTEKRERRKRGRGGVWEGGDTAGVRNVRMVELFGSSHVNDDVLRVLRNELSHMLPAR